MNSAMFAVFLETLGIVGALLVLGTVLRAKVGLFQELFFPACVIGGFVGLLLGPQGFGIISLSEDIMTTASSMPGKLFGIVIASMPMCAQKMKKGELRQRLDAVNIGIIITLVAAIQVAIGFFTNVLVTATGGKIYPGYGTEMFMGFCGGHGLSAVVGMMFDSQGVDYGETATGVALTFATIGMIGGIVIGITILNRKARKGETNYIKDPADLPIEMRTGVISNVDEQPSAGRQTTAGGSIDTLGLHFAYIAMDVGIGYLIYNLIVKLGIPFLKDMDAWLYMMFAMYPLWALTRKLGCDKYFSPEIKNKIQGATTDFIITAAIMSMPIAVVLEYWKPILISTVLGFLLTVPVILFLNKRILQEDWVEKSMAPIGMMCGDFITGVLLTRMADPELKSNALSDFSIAYEINTVYCVSMLAVIYPYVVNKGALSALYLALIQIAILAVVTFVFARISKSRNQKGS